MEIWLIKEEYSEGGTPIKKEKVICEHQIMDGAPLKGSSFHSFLKKKKRRIKKS